MQPSVMSPEERHHMSHGSDVCEDDGDLILFRETRRMEEEARSHGTLQREPISVFRHDEDILSSSDWDQHDYDWLVSSPFSPVSGSSCCNEPTGNEAPLNAASNIITVSKVKERLLQRGSTKSEISSRVACRRPSPKDPNGLGSSTDSISQKSTSSCSSQNTHTAPASKAVHSTTPVSRSAARSSTPTRLTSGASVRSATPTRQSTMSFNHVISSSSSRPSTPVRRPSMSTHMGNQSSLPGKTSPSLGKGSMRSRNTSSARFSSSSMGTGQLTTHLENVAGSPQDSISNLQVGRSRLYGLRTVVSKSYLAPAEPAQPEQVDGEAHTRRSSGSSLGTVSLTSSSEALNGLKAPIARTRRASDSTKIPASAATGNKIADRPIVMQKSGAGSRDKVPSTDNHKVLKSLKSGSSHGEKLRTNQNSNGPGQTLSKKSLDIAVRLKAQEMGGMSNNSFQSFMSNVPAASLYSVKSRIGCGCNSSSSIASSPLDTSSYASSEHGTSLTMDPDGSEYFDETSSDLASRVSSMSYPDGTMALSHEKKVSHWLASPGYLDDSTIDTMQTLEQALAGTLVTESPSGEQCELMINHDNAALEPCV
ncbi:hypothetical protein KP509_05G002700 [Ceratopteris richardii]|uniref:Uncharacterized protein n=1 Tax=Ceratopteris richardii TaxID=49495 RepID=A0A8T2UJ04_CERRI|nr:hypothetical protein KP509_05G002700 [Ceratopteris richardii]